MVAKKFQYDRMTFLMSGDDQDHIGELWREEDFGIVNSLCVVMPNSTFIAPMETRTGSVNIERVIDKKVGYSVIFPLLIVRAYYQSDAFPGVWHKTLRAFKLTVNEKPITSSVREIRGCDISHIPATGYMAT
jgi:hypothetical protein